MVDYVVSEQVIKDLVIGFENIGTRFEKLDTRIDSLEEGQQYIHKDVSFLQDDFMKRISELEVRISRLETTRTVTEGGSSLALCPLCKIDGYTLELSTERGKNLHRCPSADCPVDTYRS